VQTNGEFITAIHIIVAVEFNKARQTSILHNVFLYGTAISCGPRPTVIRNHICRSLESFLDGGSQGFWRMLQIQATHPCVSPAGFEPRTLVFERWTAVQGSNRGHCEELLRTEFPTALFADHRACWRLVVYDFETKHKIY
jgi:hypothetical protein